MDEFIVYPPQEEYKRQVQEKMDLAVSFKEETNKIELYRQALNLGLEILKKFQ